jgi:cellulose synthase/poly-beta-1,6-N-acetylglucosamine synthase-like glycosyltransferase
MIIDITRCRYAPGYLPKAAEGFFHPFFATANAAFRREALLEIDGFDRQCQTGEDVDVSIRLSRAGWELWYEPAAIVQHQERYTFHHLLRQWFGYGWGQPWLYKKHLAKPRLQFYVAGDPVKNPRPYGARCILNLPFFCYGLIFLSAYYLFHAALLVLVIGAIVHSPIVCKVAGVTALASGLYYATIRFNRRHPFRSLGMLGLRYAADTAFVAGGLAAGVRQRVVLLGATRTR